MNPHNKETIGKKEKSELPTKSWSKSCGLITNLQDRKTNHPAQKGQGTGLERKTRLKSWGHQRALKLGCCQGLKTTGLAPSPYKKQSGLQMPPSPQQRMTAREPTGVTVLGPEPQCRVKFQMLRKETT